MRFHTSSRVSHEWGTSHAMHATNRHSVHTPDIPTLCRRQLDWRHDMITTPQQISRPKNRRRSNFSKQHTTVCMHPWKVQASISLDHGHTRKNNTTACSLHGTFYVQARGSFPHISRNASSTEGVNFLQRQPHCTPAVTDISE